MKREAGYSTHGCWAPLNVIKEIEVEDRGNEWFDDDGLDLSQYEGIWVCMKPEDAVCYALFAEDVGTAVHEEAMKDPFDYVVEVSLTEAYPVLDDGDSGWLYIKERRKQNA